MLLARKGFQRSNIKAILSTKLELPERPWKTPVRSRETQGGLWETTNSALLWLNHGSPLAKPGSTMAQLGPPMAQPESAAAQPGPLAARPGPFVAQPGPPAAQLGPPGA